MTTRQAMTIKDVLENKTPVSIAMRNNGYSKNSAKRLEIKNTQAWKEMVAQYLPDYKLFEAHQDALKAIKLHGTDNDFVEIPDHSIRLKAVEMGYKLKGYDSVNVRQTNNQINISWDNGGYSTSNNKPKTLKAK